MLKKWYQLGSFIYWPGEAASSPHRGDDVVPGECTDEDITPISCPFPPFPWLIESVQPKLASEGIPIHLSRSASADQGIDSSSVS